MTARVQRTEALLEAARWFEWAAEALRRDDLIDAKKCAVTALRTLGAARATRRRTEMVREALLEPVVALTVNTSSPETEA